MLTPFLFELQQTQHIFGVILAGYNYNKNRNQLKDYSSPDLFTYFKDSGLFYSFNIYGFSSK